MNFIKVFVTAIMLSSKTNTLAETDIADDHDWFKGIDFFKSSEANSATPSTIATQTTVKHEHSATTENRLDSINAPEENIFLKANQKHNSTIANTTVLFSSINQETKCNCISDYTMITAAIVFICVVILACVGLVFAAVKMFHRKNRTPSVVLQRSSVRAKPLEIRFNPNGNEDRLLSSNSV